MRDILPEALGWLNQGKKVALATVVGVKRSGPRPLGSKMAVAGSGEMVGSVSGGCVEGAVVEQCLEALNTGLPRLLSYGISTAQAIDLGLMCGGSIDLFIEPVTATTEGQFRHLAALIEQGHPLSTATCIRGSQVGKKWIFCPDLAESERAPIPPVLLAAMEKTLRERTPRKETLMIAGGECDYFLDAFLPPLRLVVVGAVHIAIPLVQMAKILGFQTIVVDPRKAFATRERFPQVDQLIHTWPDEALSALLLDANTAVVALSHDPKLDNPALFVACQSPAAYIGALGSRKTHAGRLEELRARNLDAAQLARIHAPIGLDLGGESPEEIALSILAEIIRNLHPPHSH